MGFVTSWRPCSAWWQSCAWTESVALSGLPTLSVLCKINSWHKPPSPFSCVPMLRGWCVLSAVLVSSQRSESSLGVMQACSDSRLQWAAITYFPVSFLCCCSELSSLPLCAGSLFLINSWFVQLPGKCRRVGRSLMSLTSLLGGRWLCNDTAWESWFLSFWSSKLHTQASLLRLCGTGWLFWRELESTRGRDRGYMCRFLAYLVGRKPEPFLAFCICSVLRHFTPCPEETIQTWTPAYQENVSKQGRLFA